MRWRLKIVSLCDDNLTMLLSVDHHDFQSADNSPVLFKRSRVKFQEVHKGKFTSLCWGLAKAAWPVGRV